MTEYEVIDALSSLRSEGAEHVMNFVAVMFSYVFVAYVVGKKLTTAQALVVTVMYTIFVPGPILAIYETMSIAQDIHQIYGEGVSVATSVTGWLLTAPIAVPFTLVFAWIVSLVFMVQMRKQTNKNGT